jgi:hypothetical protein
VRTRKGTDIRKFAQHRFIYKTIYHTIYVVSVRKGTSICEFAQLGLLYKSIYNIDTCIPMKMPMHTKRF